MSKKNVDVISFSKEDRSKPVKCQAYTGVILPADMPKIDITVRGGDILQVETRNGKVHKVSRNGKEIEKRLVAGKMAEIERAEKQNERE